MGARHLLLSWILLASCGLDAEPSGPPGTAAGGKSDGTSASSPGCRVAYRITGEWPGGGIVDLSVLPGRALDGWKLAWRLPGDEQIADLWNGQHRQSGADVEVAAVPYNRRVEASGSLQLGFVVRASGRLAQPAQLTLDGVPCDGLGGAGGAGAGGAGAGGASAGGAGAGGAGAGGAGAGGAGAAGTGGSPPVGLVDDLEDGDLGIPSREGRGGRWFAFTDGTAQVALSVAPGGAAGTQRALHATASAFGTWGGGVGVVLRGTATNAPQPYDASSCSGLSLWARVGSGPARSVRLSVPDRATDASAGVCRTCNDHFGKDLPLTTQWREHRVRWSELTQGGWGDRQPGLATAALYAVQLQVGAGAPLDVWVDQLTLTDCGAGGGGAGASGGGAGDTPVSRHGRLRVVGTRLVDEAGTAVQLRGVSSMWLNWEDDGFAESLDALRWMRDEWKLTVIRAAMGVEPSGAYLSNPDRATAQVDRIVQNAVAAGVYVIVDWHAHQAEQHRDRAVDFFTRMAQRYRDLPNVLFETYNEPLAVSWSGVLRPYHEAVVGAIRAQGFGGVIVLGTGNWSQDVDQAAQSPLAGTNLMYTLHFYACTHTQWLRDRASAAIARGLPLFVTEWGATHADGGLDGVVCQAEAQRWHDLMNAQGMSWTAWKLDDCEPDSSCLLRPGAPVAGPWTDTWLHGHGAFVRDRMRD